MFHRERKLNQSGNGKSQFTKSKPDVDIKEEVKTSR